MLRGKGPEERKRTPAPWSFATRHRPEIEAARLRKQRRIFFRRDGWRSGATRSGLQRKVQRPKEGPGKRLQREANLAAMECAARLWRELSRSVPREPNRIRREALLH